MKHSFAAFAAVLSLGLVVTSAGAQEVTLRLHQFLPIKATTPSLALIPWAEKVEKESGGRIRIEHFPSMQLGGKPSSLYDQAKDGVVDLVWTLPGYTPGRFPKTEAFELPFMVTTGEATSRAFQAFYEKHLGDEFADTHVLCVHTHGPGLVHTRPRAVETLEDLDGLKLRGASRVINDMLGKLGATPVGMPVPAVPESLSKGVIDGALLPWEVTVPLKVAELAPHHTGVSGKNGLYTATFVFTMNKASYAGLPDDLKAVIDANSGAECAALFGRAMDRGDVTGQEIAARANNTIVTLDEAETRRWRDAAKPVIDTWIKEMDDRGLDGATLYQDALALIEKHSS